MLKFISFLIKIPSYYKWFFYIPLLITTIFLIYKMISFLSFRWTVMIIFSILSLIGIFLLYQQYIIKSNPPQSTFSSFNIQKWQTYLKNPTEENLRAFLSDHPEYKKLLQQKQPPKITKQTPRSGKK